MRQAGLEDLRKGQKLSSEIYDNWGKAAAQNLRLKGVMKTGSGRAAVPIQSAMVETNGNEMKFSIMKKNSLKRTPIPRAALERALAERIKANQQCEGFLEIFLERVAPVSHGAANWGVKGVKYGKAERNKCNAAITHCVEERKLEFDISD